jgi:sulfoxide reductase catalytic subunit YedY
MKKLKESDVTPEEIYLARPRKNRVSRLNRRQFLVGAGTLTAGAFLAACGVKDEPTEEAVTLQPTQTPDLAGTLVAESEVDSGGKTDELGDPVNEYMDITHYNNYYEFSTDKGAVALESQSLITSPWQVEVGGFVNRPKTFDIDDLRKFEQEERIYRLRCVEAWSMVIPWFGFPVSRLLKEVEPTSQAKYVRFETLFDPEQMPGQNSRFYSWPYVEGLRMDEAMHDLTILATGLYGKDLLPQNGAPIRLVVPWKYGFKSIKSIVKIELVEFEPISLWTDAAPNEYGFYANVNPEVDHPRWSQASERRIGEASRRRTLKFNGYEEQVSGLYTGMDLKINY